jgi:hypothetical protein
VIKIDSMQKNIDFSIEKKHFVKKLCWTQAYGNNFKMNIWVLLAFLPLISDLVAGEFPGEYETLKKVMFKCENLCKTQFAM